MHVQNSYFKKASITKFPTKWTLENEEEGTTSKIKKELEFTDITIKHIGHSTDKNKVEARAIRSDFPVPEKCPLYIFEIEIISSGYNGAGHWSSN